ncbi:MAG TPA: M56 family metallopeptidase, partial [Mucilaginibacter sp.]|nr:M56 family metallopeptidase [Mucilaginibacter sp.]
MHLSIADIPVIPLFLFKLSLSLGVVWGFYQLWLRRLTFYNLNRWYLLGYSLISFFIPLINIGPMLSYGPAGEPVMIRLIPAIGGVERGAMAATPVAAGPSGWTVLLWVLGVGSGLLMLRLALRWFSLFRLRRNAQSIGDSKAKIYQIDGLVNPFSFGDAIYINPRLHTEKEWEDIVLHEYVHIRQRHTIDILIAELVCVINWYNPFAWLIRYSIRQNQEFIADEQVLVRGVDRKGYQYHLLKVLGEPRYRLANNFSFSSLKKRIVMMNKMRSARVHMLKLLFLVPLVGLLLVAFRDRYMGLLGTHGPVYMNAAGIVIRSPDRAPLDGVEVRDRETGLHTTTDARGYYKLQIPVLTKSATVHLEYTKPGY